MFRTNVFYVCMYVCMDYIITPSSVKEVAEKVNIGIPSQRILQGIMTNNECFFIIIIKM